MTFDQYTAELRRRMAAADRITAMRRRRLDRLCREAGWSAYPGGCVLHNASIGAKSGRPWRTWNGATLDGSAIRRAVRLERELFVGHRIVSRWYSRTARDFEGLRPIQAL